jgi:hypothetical protein
MRELISANFAYRRKLNEAEQENITRAQIWPLNRRRDPRQGPHFDGWYITPQGCTTPKMFNAA